MYKTDDLEDKKRRRRMDTVSGRRDGGQDESKKQHREVNKVLPTHTENRCDTHHLTIIMLREKKTSFAA